MAPVRRNRYGNATGATGRAGRGGPRSTLRGVPRFDHLAELLEPVGTAHRRDPLRAVYRRAREQGVCGSVRDVRNARRLRTRPQEELAEAINSITYYNNKAKYIRSACADIAEQHDGEVPDTMSELTELAGVGRKTANVVLQHGHDVVEGSSSTPTSSGSPAGSRSRKRRARRRSNRTSSTWFPRRTGSSSRIS